MTNALTDDLLRKVKATRANRAEADARLLQAVQALERTERFAESRRKAVERNRASIEAARSERARELQAVLAADKPTLGLEIGVDPSVLAQQSGEESALVGAEGAVNLARANRELLAVEAKSAESTLANAVERLLVAEAEQNAVEILRHEEQAVLLREKLIPLLPHSRPRGQSIFPASATVTRALEPPGFLEPSRYVAMAGENGPHRQRILRHAKDWEARRAALIAGESSDATNAVEAA